MEGNYISDLELKFNTHNGLKFKRRYTKKGVHPYDTIKWGKRDVILTSIKGDVIFEQRNVEYPEHWTQNAVQIVTSKYFHGKLNTDQRETSLKQLIDRVIKTITQWGLEGGYFADKESAEIFEMEMTDILMNQRCSFNSPVWFNLGTVVKPQGSACQPFHSLINTPNGFIPIGKIVEGKMIGQEVITYDGVTTVEDVKINGKKEVFRVTLSDGHFIEATADHLIQANSKRRIKSHNWKLLKDAEVGDFMQYHRENAAISNSYISNSKELSEIALVGWLQADGMVGQYFTSPHSKKKTIIMEFMTVNQDEEDWVIEHFNKVFPGFHYWTTQVESTKDQGLIVAQRIRLSGEKLRPFVEKYNLFEKSIDYRIPDVLWSAPDDMVIAYLKSVYQSEGYVSSYDNSSRIGIATISKQWMEDISILLGRFGVYGRLREKVDKRENRHNTWVIDIRNQSERIRFSDLIGFISAEKNEKMSKYLLTNDGKAIPDIIERQITSIVSLGMMNVYDIQTANETYLTNSILVHNCFINAVEDNMNSILELVKTEGIIFKYGSGSGVNLSPLRANGELLSTGGSSSGPISFMKGYDSFAGSIKSGGKTRRAAKMVLLDDWHPDVIDFIESKEKEEKKAWALIDAGYDGSFTGEAYSSVFFQNANHSVRVSDEFMENVLTDGIWDLINVGNKDVRKTIKAKDMLDRISEATHVCGDPGLQYKTTINKWHTCKNSGPINASNPCSEYVFLDNTACNLASINLLKYRNENGSFDVENFTHTVDLTITAQEIIVGRASYPTSLIEKNSHVYRTLGLGYTNLGAFIMSLGFPYDSKEGRNIAAAITSLMTGRAYLQSSKIAANLGAFSGFAENRESMLEVIQMHNDATNQLSVDGIDMDLYESATSVWKETLESGWEHGYRNAQASVLAPTGCLTPDTLVPTDKGILRLGKIGDIHGDKWQDIDFNVSTDKGPQRATKFYVNGNALTRKIVTSAGYTIQGTLKHKIKVVDKETKNWEWKQLSEIKEGDIVPIALNYEIGTPKHVALPPLGDLHWNADFNTKVPREVTEDLCELVGYYMGDGSLHAKGLRFCVPNNDSDVVDRLTHIARELFNLKTVLSQREGYIEVSAHSTLLSIWWDACGFGKTKPTKEHTGKGYIPQIPDAILETNNPIFFGAFLRGLFEADGTVTLDVPSISTAHDSFANEIKVLLLVLGIPTSIKTDKPYSNHFGKNDMHSIRLRNKSYNHIFMRKIGFIGERKEARVSLAISERSQRYDLIHISRDLIDTVLPIGNPMRRNVLQAYRRHSAVPRAQIQKIFDETQNEILGESLKFFYDSIKQNIDGGEQPTYDLSVPSNVTYIANGFISHNTISFMMDADTTGIEPDIALIKYKKLVGGGHMKIVNNTISLALTKLGYTEEEIVGIVKYVHENGIMEGCEMLKKEHLPVFDCSIKSSKGTRTIHHMGHVSMMASVQPFLSGAISKTVNMPEDVSIDEISETYIKGWEMGLKAIAIYRDNSKRLQPLNTEVTEKKKKSEPKSDVGPIRIRMPETRLSKIHKFEVNGHEGYIIVGLYENGLPGEVFIKMSKQGSTLGGVMDSLAVLISISLQYGVPLKILTKKFKHTKFEPMGMTSNAQIPIASSIIDYIFRWLALEFLGGDDGNGGVLDYTDLRPVTKTPAEELPQEEENTASMILDDNQICSNCGGMAVRSGSCYACPECGTTSGCS